MLLALFFATFLFYQHESLAASVGCGRQAASYTPNLGASKLRIVNGEQARPHSWPWAVSFQNFMQSHTCGGSLLRVKDDLEQTDIVLTAAHCIPQINTNGKPVGPFLKPYSVIVGNHAQSTVEKGEERVSLADFRIHQNYSKMNKVNDIAVVKLVKPVAFSDTVRSICLPQKQEAVALGQTCVAAGWGRIDPENDRGLSDTLQQTISPVHDQNKCQQSWIRIYNKDVMTCAGSLTGSSSVCNGDSGGPLVCQAADGSWIQQGVANFVENNSCTGKKPPVYARVSVHVDWIREQIDQLTSLK